MRIPIRELNTAVPMRSTPQWAQAGYVSKWWSGHSLLCGNPFAKTAAVKPLPVLKPTSLQHHDLPEDPNKTRILVLGSGWGAVSFLRHLDPGVLSSTYPSHPFVTNIWKAKFASFVTQNAQAQSLCLAASPALLLHTPRTIQGLEGVFWHQLMHWWSLKFYSQNLLLCSNEFAHSFWGNARKRSMAHSQKWSWLAGKYDITLVSPR